MKHRIVSLIASSTEMVCALGFEKELVGRSHECDFPQSVASLPVCTEPKFNVEGSSREIDQRVKETLKDALSVYRVDEGVLQKLRPTHIITQDQCEVCAVSLKDVELALCKIIDSNPKIVSLSPNSLEDVWNDILKVAESLEAPEKGEGLIQEFKKRIEGISLKAQAISPKPTVACIEWIDPLMAGGNWVPELVEMAGGVNLFGEAGKHSPWMTWEDLKEKDPDILIILPCGYDIKKTRIEMSVLSEKKDWSELKAVKNKKVFLTDGNQYFNRPGPRLVESLEILAEIFHPDAFEFGHKGYGWEVY